MKVFCIGAWKTGTTSTGSAINYLIGGEHQDWNNHRLRKLYMDKKFSNVVKAAKPFKTFDDAPWNCHGIWQRLISAYPTSKFILTIRDKDSWIKSMIKWYEDDILTNRPKDRVTELYDMQLSPYGYDIKAISKLSENKDKWISWINTRNSDIINTIPSKRLLVYDVSDGWEPLCKFLSMPIPSKAFPKLNIQRYS